MNKKQELAADRLRKALNHCGKVGLTGGIYEGGFCLWDITKTHPHDESDFYDTIQKEGMILYSPKIHLDGGTGW